MSVSTQTILRWILTASTEAPPHIREIALNLWTSTGEELIEVGKSESASVLVTSVQLRELKETARANKIAAIKKLRDFTLLRTGKAVGLKDAKDIIESF